MDPKQQVVPFAVVRPKRPGMTKVVVPPVEGHQRTRPDVTNDELVRMVGTLAGSSPIDPILRQMAEDLAHLKAARDALDPEDSDYAEIVLKRTRALKMFHDLYERRAWRGAALNVRSDALKPIFEVWVERLRKALVEEGYDSTRESALLQCFSRCLEGWEDEAEDRLGAAKAR